MLRAALRDLQWRRKRFVIAMLGVGLVFAMGLVMTGLAASFSLEVDRTLSAVGAQLWVVSADASGPCSRSPKVPRCAHRISPPVRRVECRSVEHGWGSVGGGVSGVALPGAGAGDAE